jgi:hypothetical protein
MAVAAADDQLVPLPGEIQNRPILFPASQSAQFESVDEVTEPRDKIGEYLDMTLPTDSREVPQRVIENDQ